MLSVCLKWSPDRRKRLRAPSKTSPLPFPVLGAKKAARRARATPLDRDRSKAEAPLEQIREDDLNEN